MTSEVLERLRQPLSDRYRVERELGAGGMATVYLAHDLKHDRPVAIKVLHPELGAVLGAERFLSEIRTTANLQHPNILPLFDSGAVDGLVFYVMPYVEGETLRGRIAREGQLSVADAVKLAQGVASALDYAHRHGVIHRDIKPENILLQDGQALVADFGVALAVSNAGGARITQTGISVGTPQYMSPEQAAAERQLDGRSDQYSLAAVLYEMLAGEAPFSGPSAPAILTKLMTEQVPPLSTRRPSVPGGLADAVHRALEKVPADRFATAAEFAEALTRERTGAYRVGQAASSRSPLTSRWVVVVGGVAVIALIAGAIAWGRVLGEASVASPIIRVPIAIADPPRTRSTWSDGIKISRDGTKLGYYTSNGWRIIDLRTGETRAASAEIIGLGLLFSPKGDSVALSTTSRLQQVYVADLATGRATRIVDCCAAPSYWDLDGWIYHQDLKRQFVRTQISTKKIDVLVPFEGGAPVLASSAMPVGARGAILYTRMPASASDPAVAEIVVDDRTGKGARALLRGVRAMVTASGFLVSVDAKGTMVASRFDPSALELSGAPARVLDSVEVRQSGFMLPSAAFDLSDEGTLVYVRAEPVSEDSILVVDRAGRPRGRARSMGGWINNIARSGDGRRIAASVHRGLTVPNIWVIDGDSPPRRLTFSDNLDYSPWFLENGSDIAFIGSDKGKNWDLFKIPFSGAASPQLMLDREGDIQSPRFTRDGRWVVFCDRSVIGQSDVMAHRFGADSATVAVANSPAYECGADVSPDGRWVTFVSNESGRPEVYVKPFAREGTARWQVTTDAPAMPGSGPLVSVGPSATPRWSSSGQELFYVNPRGQLISVPVSTGTGFSFGTPRILFTLPDGAIWSGDIVPGDQEFILVTRRLEAPGQVIMIRNFDRLLQEKVGK